MKKRKGFGLVFAGGGGKGAYEIGVWKALLEAKQIEIGAVSGTSVGALNAALYAGGSYEEAENIWIHIDEDKILTSTRYECEKYLPEYLRMCRSALSKTNLKQMGAAMLFRKYLSSHIGLFSRQGLIEIIQNSGITEKLSFSKIPCYATCYNMSEMRTQYFQLNDLPSEKVVSVLLASSAIPVIFPKEDIEGAEYCDGGLPFIGENIPVKPLYDAGWRDFIVVHLERDGIEQFTKYKKCRFIHIFPKKNQGGLSGTLDFNPESAKDRLNQGYKDMKKQIEMLNGLDGHLDDREKVFKEVRTESGKYYDSMKRSIESCNTELVSCSEEEDEFSFVDSEDEYEKMYRRLSKNRSKMNDFMLKSVAAMTAADAQLDERYRKQGSLVRMITGKNKRLQQGIDMQLVYSQRNVVKMISKLVESDVITIDVLHTLQSQLYGSTYQMAKVLESHDKRVDDLDFNFEKICKKYNELVGRNEDIAEEINRLYSLIEDKVQRADEKFQNVEDEIEGMKDAQRLEKWVLNLKFRQFYGMDYRDLDTVGKIICVVSDFFCLTNGVWNNELLLFIKTGLDELGIDPSEQMSCGEIIYKLVIDNRYAQYLFVRNGIQYIFQEQENEIVTQCEALIQGVYICNRLADVQEGISRQQINRYLSDKNVPIEEYLSAFDIACMLLITLARYHECADSRKRLAAYREIEKMALLGDIDAMQKFTRILLENSYIEEAFKKMSLLERVVEKNDNFQMLRDEVLERYSNCGVYV